MTSTDQSHAAAFVRAICERPDDIGLRLVYADWLEERDDPRGEFVRIQVELATILPQPQCDCRDDFVPHRDDCPSHIWVLKHYSRYEALRCRERELLGLCCVLIHRSLPLGFRCVLSVDGQDRSSLPVLVCRRGFAESVSCSYADWQQHGPAIVQVAPVTELQLSGHGFNWAISEIMPTIWGCRIPCWPWEIGLVVGPSEEILRKQSNEAAIHWARAKAGLLALTEERT